MGGWFRYIIKDSVRVEREQPASSPCCENVSFTQRLFSRRAIQVGEVLLADRVNPSSLYLLYLFAIGRLQGREDSNITGLELMRCVRGHAAQSDVVLEAKLQDLESLMRSKAIPHEYSRFLVSSLFSLRVKHKLEPLQADIRIGEARIRACIYPTRRGIRGPVRSMG